jgi:predicted Zn-dependent peptidase
MDKRSDCPNWPRNWFEQALTVLIAGFGTLAAKAASAVSRRLRGVSQEELDRAKTALIADWAFDADDLLSLARRYGEGLAAGRSIEDIEVAPERIGRVTVDDIKRAADQFLIDRAAVSGTATSPPSGPATANDKR